MASALESKRQFEDITECVICTEVYTDPRAVPCMHTFCLKCIEHYGKGKQSGDELACPLCRQCFAVPAGGLKALPSNHFVNNMLNAKKVTKDIAGDVPCELCENPTSERIPANVFCLECQKNMCLACDAFHKKVPMCRGHQTTAIGEQNIAKKYSADYCDLHKDKLLEIYCEDCKVVTCLTCYIDGHKTHGLSYVNQVAEEFRSQMTADVSGLGECAEKCKQILNDVAHSRADFIGDIANADKAICDEAEAIKKTVDRHRQNLIDKLYSLKASRLKEVDGFTERVDLHLTITSSMKKYASELAQNGSAADVTREAKALHEKSIELVNSDLLKHGKQDLGSKKITYQPVEVKEDNIVGKLVVNSIKDARPHLINSSKALKGITALAANRTTLFVAYSSACHIIDAEDFTLLRQWKELKEAQLACCREDNCCYSLYVSQNKVYIEKLDSSPYRTKMSKIEIRGMLMSISMTNDHNLLLLTKSDFFGNSLAEFTRDGSRVNDIHLSRDIESPKCAVQLADGQYILSHHGSLHRVCIVGQDGQLVRSYGNTPGSDDGQLNKPMSLQVDSNGCILVADRSNDRILLLNPSFTHADELALPVDGGLHRPCHICLVETPSRSTRLYVAEEAGRVLVFEFYI